ncbi:MAG TPA: ornithine carbamoyltransferase [Candidatus Pelagibacter sp.]|jgi:ornithine carbamoyltransferase|nr:ornithine carbamoyltransferase [Candidatus Pelagibacter sp.]
MRKFINIADVSKKDLRLILDNAKLRKEKRSGLNKNAVDPDAPLDGKILIMIFEKPSTRTRISFDLAVKQLGGKSLILNPDEIHYGTGNESLYDTAKVLSQYADIVMLRTHAHKNVVEFSKHLSIPIINGLTNLSHPCQIMSDIMTFEELKGPIKNKKIAWLGDGNNIVYSLIEAAVQFDFELCIASPKGYEPNKNILQWAKKNKGNITITKDPIKAANSADCVMTDKWISMGDKINKSKKKKILKPYQVNKKIMKVAAKNSIFMHCLPASRGEEVTSDVMDGKQSAVWLEALNRIHAQKSIIEWCLI